MTVGGLSGTPSFALFWLLGQLIAQEEGDVEVVIYAYEDALAAEPFLQQLDCGPFLDKCAVYHRQEAKGTKCSRC